MTAVEQSLHWSDITVTGAFIVGMFLGIVVVLGVARFGARLVDRYIDHRFFHDCPRHDETPPD